MMAIKGLEESKNGQYCTNVTLNLYDSPKCEDLATQAAAGRHLRILSQTPIDGAIEVCLSEDGYVAWLSLEKVRELKPAPKVYQAIALSRSEIESRLPEVIAFTKAAIKQPNYYFWGGTVSPNYDCSGLIQAAFAASGIWLPRDSYQQEAFTKTITLAEVLPGDLIFFGTVEKVNHVALYLGEGYYIHSSGKDKGRNGIGIDQLSEDGDLVSRSYYQQLLGFGRVICNYIHPYT
ncbi:MAG: C40 family peptidase [Moorea sp. SIO2B7]|nr:C40 family peptidase [Moorena sp. SIO2B7]